MMIPVIHDNNKQPLYVITVPSFNSKQSSQKEHRQNSILEARYVFLLCGFIINDVS